MTPFAVGRLAATMSVALATLSGCTIVVEAPAAVASPVVEEKSSEPTVLDVMYSPPCMAFREAYSDFFDLLGDESSSTNWVVVYESTSLAVASAARKAKEGSTLRATLHSTASVLADSADNVRATGGLSTKKYLEFKTAMASASDACGINHAFG